MILTFNCTYKYMCVCVNVTENEKKIFLWMGLQREELEEAIFIFLL